MSFLINKLLNEADEAGATFVDIIISDSSIAFISNTRKRRSTRNYKLDKNDIHAIEKILKHLDEKAMLFCNNLNEIRITLQDGRKAYFIRKVNGHLYRIKSKKVTEKNEKNSLWIKFYDGENPKIGIAYLLNDKGNQVVPCDGAVLSRMFTLDMSCDLQFVVGANFNIKDNQLDERYEQEHRVILEKLVEIIKKSIREVFHLKLMDMSFLSVLPNTMDDDNVVNIMLRNAVKNECLVYPIFKNETGTYANVSKVMIGSPEIMELFNQELINILFNHEKYWVSGCKSGSREEYFLIDIGVKNYDRESFLYEIFSEEYFDELSVILAKQNDKWLRKFYIFCAERIYDETVYKRMVSGINNIMSIRDNRGRMRYPYEVSFATNINDTIQDTSIIKLGLIYPSDKEDEFTPLLKQFLIECLGVKEYSQIPDILKVANDLETKKQKIDENYAKKLLLIANFDNNHVDKIDFSKYAIFPSETKRGLKRLKASEIVIGKPYIKEGNLLAVAYDRQSLWKGFAKIYSEDELKIVLAFAERCGALGSPKIRKTPVEQHPKFNKELYAQGRILPKDTNYDYNIPELEALLRRHSIQINRMIWQAILDLQDSSEVLYAEYSCDGRTTVNKTDSSLVILLRERTWIPDRKNKLFTPENIKIEDIHEDFIFDKKNDFLKSLRFGQGESRKKKELRNLICLAKKLGYEVISKEEYQEYIKWKENFINEKALS